jgi:hypothetical protein
MKTLNDYHKEFEEKFKATGTIAGEGFRGLANTSMNEEVVCARFDTVWDFILSMNREMLEEAVREYHKHITTSYGEFKEMSADDSKEVLETYLSQTKGGNK